MALRLFEKASLVRIGVLSAFLAAAVAQPLRPVRVTGASMEPTYANGTWTLANQNVGDLRRGDVVLINKGDEMMVKRIAFVPGDTLYHLKSVRGPRGVIFRVTDKMARSSMIEERRVPQDQFFVLGDNMDRSTDSRSFGFVSRSEIIGKLTDQRSQPVVQLPISGVGRVASKD